MCHLSLTIQYRDISMIVGFGKLLFSGGLETFQGYIPVPCNIIINCNPFDQRKIFHARWSLLNAWIPSCWVTAKHTDLQYPSGGWPNAFSIHKRLWLGFLTKDHFPWELLRRFPWKVRFFLWFKDKHGCELTLMFSFLFQIANRSGTQTHSVPF